MSCKEIRLRNVTRILFRRMKDGCRLAEAISPILNYIEDTSNISSVHVHVEFAFPPHSHSADSIGTDNGSVATGEALTAGKSVIVGIGGGVAKSSQHGDTAMLDLNVTETIEASLVTILHEVEGVPAYGLPAEIGGADLVLEGTDSGGGAGGLSGGGKGGGGADKSSDGGKLEHG